MYTCVYMCLRVYVCMYTCVCILKFLMVILPLSFYRHPSSDSGSTDALALMNFILQSLSTNPTSTTISNTNTSSTAADGATTVTELL